MRPAGVSELHHYHGDGMKEDNLACRYGNLIDAAGGRRQEQIDPCTELVTWKRECHVSDGTKLGKMNLTPSVCICTYLHEDSHNDFYTSFPVSTGTF
jgi:hypothetical protein